MEQIEIRIATIEDAERLLEIYAYMDGKDYRDV